MGFYFCALLNDAPSFELGRFRLNPGVGEGGRGLRFEINWLAWCEGSWNGREKCNIRQSCHKKNASNSIFKQRRLLL